MAPSRSLQEVIKPTPSPTPPVTESSKNIGAIAGGSVGGIAVIALAIFLVTMSAKRNKKLERGKSSGSSELKNVGVSVTVNRSLGDAGGKSVRSGWVAAAGSEVR